MVRTRFVLMSTLFRTAKAIATALLMLSPVRLNTQKSFASVPPVNVAMAVIVSPSEDIANVPLGGLEVVQSAASVISSRKPMPRVIVMSPNSSLFLHREPRSHQFGNRAGEDYDPASTSLSQRSRSTVVCHCPRRHLDCSISA